MKVKKISIALWCLAVLALVPLLPVTRAAAIAVAESILGRALNFARPWNEIMILCGLLGFAALAILGFAYNVFDFHDFVSADLQSDNFRHFGVKSGVKILDDKRFAVAFVLVFAALVALRCYWISQKKSYHMDELASMNYANVNVHGFWHVKDIVPWETNRLYTGKELNDLGFWDDPSLFDVFSDLVALHINNGGDLMNCNFYHTLLRLWFTGVGGGVQL